MRVPSLRRQAKKKNGTIYLKFSEKIVLSTCRIFKRWTGVG
jgi:hypothetical protein